jgi:hypothetical protein
MQDEERRDRADNPAGTDSTSAGSGEPSPPPIDRLILRGQTKSPGEESDPGVGGPGPGDAV